MRHGADEMKKRIILSEVALGHILPDTIIINGTLFNVFTREFINKPSSYTDIKFFPLSGQTHLIIQGEGKMPGSNGGEVP